MSPYFVIYYPDTQSRSEKVAMFDLDWTLIHPTKGQRSKVGDYYMLPERSKKLKELKDQGYDIVIFTSWTQKYDLDFIRGKIDYFFTMLSTELGEHFDCFVFCIVNSSISKPNKYTFDYYYSYYNNNLKLDQSFYCGDAAGRTHIDSLYNYPFRIDYSNVDREFANNINVEFKVPEQVFPHEDLMIPYGCREIVLMMGMPGSGKTWISKDFFVDRCGYKIVQQSFLKTYEKCIRTTEYYLNQGYSVVVDNTNPGLETRMGYVRISQRLQIPIRLIYVAEDGHTVNSQRPDPVPEMAYYRYYNNLVYPSTQEGYYQLIIWWAKESDSFVSPDTEDINSHIPTGNIPTTTNEIVLSFE